MGKSRVNAVVIRQDELATDIYSVWLRVGDMAVDARPGQFVSVYSGDGSRLLPRPISICEIHPDMGAIRLVYRVVGAGTRELSFLRSDDTVKIIGTLGNGYTVTGEHPLLIAGGIGIPPMLELAKQFSDPAIVVGYRDELFLDEDLSSRGRLFIASEDGKHGVQGNVMDAIREYGLKGDVIYSCGPLPMLRAVKDYAIREDIPCYISMEERMACGIGACLGCVVQTVEQDEHSRVNNVRVCKDGPVFDAREVVL